MEIKTKNGRDGGEGVWTSGGIGAHRMPGRGHCAMGIGLRIVFWDKNEASRTHLSHVRLERAFVLFLVYNPRRIKRNGALGMLDERRGAACPESGVQCSGLAAKVGHAPGDLAGKLVAPHEGLYVCHPAFKKGQGLGKWWGVKGRRGGQEG